MNFQTKIKQIQVEGETRFFPVYVIGEEEHLISHQDTLVYFATKEEAEEYLNDEL